MVWVRDRGCRLAAAIASFAPDAYENMNMAAPTDVSGGGCDGDAGSRRRSGVAPTTFPVLLLFRLARAADAAAGCAAAVAGTAGCAGSTGCAAAGGGAGSQALPGCTGSAGAQAQPAHSSAGCAALPGAPVAVAGHMRRLCGWAAPGGGP